MSLVIKRSPAVDSNKRAWSQVYDDINDIIKAVNRKSTDESRTKGSDGNDGNIRLFKDNSKAKYFIEGKFKDGWAKRELLFSDADDATQDESINFSATESYVKPDGTVPFTSPVVGIAPSNASHLTTRGYADTGRLTSVTKSGNNLVFGMTDTASNITFSQFGANAFNSTAIPTTFVASLTNADASGQTLIEASTGSLYRLGGGDNITITTDDPGGGQTWVQIDCDINTSNFLGSSVNRIEGIRTFDTDAFTATQSMGSGGYIILDEDNSNVTATFNTVTVGGTSYPSVRLNGAAGYTHPTSAGNKHVPSGGSSGQFLKYSSSGTAIWATPSYTTNTDTNHYITGGSINSSGVLTLTGTGSSGALIDLSEQFLLTSAGALTATSTHTLTNKSGNISQWTNNSGYATASSSTAFTNKSGNIDQWTNNSGYITSSDDCNSPNVVQTITLTGDVTGSGTGSFATTVANDSHTHNTQYYTQATIDTTLADYAPKANPAFTGTVKCEDGLFVVDTDDESGYSAGFKKAAVDRVDIGWGGSGGGNMEVYSKSHSSRPGEFKVIYGGSGSTGAIYFTHYDGSNWTDRTKIDLSGHFHTDGDVYAYSNSVGSDRKLKKNIKDTKYGLSDVLKLRGVDFDWKEKRDGVHDIGVIAQEVREVIPEVVNEVTDLVEDKYLSVDYSKLVPVLIESIKELKEEIDGLRKS